MCPESPKRHNVLKMFDYLFELPNCPRTTKAFTKDFSKNFLFVIESKLFENHLLV